MTWVFQNGYLTMKTTEISKTVMFNNKFRGQTYTLYLITIYNKYIIIKTNADNYVNK